MKKYGIETEPSGAAGLALYLQRYDERQIREGRKIMVVNTGSGLYEEGDTLLK
jgi:threonine synthase